MERAASNTARATGSRLEPDLLVQGAIGGLIAGAVVASWFLVIDFAGGEPFSTPARLASIVLREEYRGPWPRLVAWFTLLHFGIFVSLGAATAWFLRQIDVEPGVVVGAVVGVGVLNAVHYTGLLVTGTNLLTVVPVAHVFGANLLGGILMMTYLHRALEAETPFGLNVLRRYPILFDGVVTGLIGATMVAFWLFLADVIAGRPFYTPAALGSAVLLGASSAAEIRLSLGIIVAYSFLHLGVFALLGIAFTWFASQAERAPAFWARVAAVFALLEGGFLGTVAMVSGWVVRDLGWWTVLVANLLAVASMGVWTWARSQTLKSARTKDRRGSP